MKHMRDFVYKTKPWEHQVKALEYLYDRDTAALYTDMGAGKSKIIIDLIVNKRWTLLTSVTFSSELYIVRFFT